MPELLPAQSQARMPFVDSLRIYTLVTGELVMPMGNLKVVVSPQEAEQYLSDLLVRAKRFASVMQASGNGVVHVAPTRVPLIVRSENP